MLDSSRLPCGCLSGINTSVTGFLKWMEIASPYLGTTEQRTTVVGLLK
jgi:hypothetical protein